MSVATAIAVLLLSAPVAVDTIYYEANDTIGSLHGDPAFGSLVDVVVVEDTIAYALDSQARSVLQVILTSDRSSFRWVGSPGKGPGSFERPVRLGIFDSGIWIVDLLLNRYSFFDHNLSLLATEKVLYAPESEHFWPSTPRSRLSGGYFVARLTPVPGPTSDSAQLPFVLLTPDLQVTDTLATAAADHVVWTVSAPGLRGRYRGNQPFSDSPLVAADDAGGCVVVVHRKGNALGAASIEVYDSIGNSIANWRITGYDAVELTDQRVNSVVRLLSAGYAERASDTDAEAFEVAARTALYRPEYLPLITRVEVQQGVVSLLLAGTEESESTFRVWAQYRADGSFLGHVAVPHDMEALWFNGKVAWGRMTDQYGVPYLVRLTPAR